MILTLCGLTSQKANQGGLRLSGSVHEEAHPEKLIHRPIKVDSFCIIHKNIWRRGTHGPSGRETFCPVLLMCFVRYINKCLAIRFILHFVFSLFFITA